MVHSGREENVGRVGFEEEEDEEDDDDHTDDNDFEKLY